MRLRQLAKHNTFRHNGIRYLRLGRSYRTAGEKPKPLWMQNVKREKLSGEIIEDWTFAARMVNGKLDLVRFHSGTLVEDTGPVQKKDNRQASPSTAKTHAEYLELPPTMLAWFKYRETDGTISERRELLNSAQILDIIKPLVAEKRLLDFTEYSLTELDSESSQRKNNSSAKRKMEMGREIAQLILAFAS